MRVATHRTLLLNLGHTRILFSSVSRTYGGDILHPTTFLGAGRMSEGPLQETEKPAPGSLLPDQKPVSPKQVVVTGVWATFSTLMGLLGTLPNLKSYADSLTHGQWLSWLLLAVGLAFLVGASALIYKLRSMLSRMGPERSWQFFARIP